MSRPSWSAMRTPIAFAVAPLACPLIISLYFKFAAEPSAAPSEDAAVVAMMAAFATIGVYLFVLSLGVPIYLLLRERNLTAFWIFPLVGYLGGALVIFLVGMPRPFEPHIAAMALKMFGPIGAVVCSIIWLIARPDLHARKGEPGGAAVEGGDGTTSTAA